MLRSLRTLVFVFLQLSWAGSHRPMGCGGAHQVVLNQMSRHRFYNRAFSVVALAKQLYIFKITDLKRETQGSLYS